MGYEKVLYEADDNNKYQGRVSDEILAIANNAPASGTATSSVNFEIGKTNREFGIRPRLAICTREVEVPGESRAIVYKLKIPIFTKAAWASANWQKQASVSYNDETWTVTGREPEDY